MNDEQGQTAQPETVPVTRITVGGRQLFPSLVTMRHAHRDLLRRYRSEGSDTPILIDEIMAFVNEACATGLLIDDEEDRWTAQGLIDYWTTVLYRLGRESFDTTLNDFDETHAPALPDSVCPYLGLGAFSEEEQDRFFGRERLTEDALKALETHGCVAVVGPSGSGKSSLVLAGILPALKDGVLAGSDEWLYLEPVTPGEKPLVNLAGLLFGERTADAARRLRRGPSVLYDQLTLLAEEGHATTAVLFIDEFEELFTLCTDENIRNDFIANLIHAFDREEPRHVLVLAMHSDYEHQIGRWPRLKKIFTAATVRVTPPTAVELRQAITLPAAAVGLRFDDGLIDRLLQDVSGERIALPLLQFTLLNLWDNRDRNRITWEAYNRLGGGRSSLVARARQFYADLPANEQLVAQRILMALVDPGSAMGVDLLRVTRDELLRVGGSPERIEQVLDKIVAQRLVRIIPGEDETTDGDEQYEIVHEALTQDWPELVEWLDERRFEQRQRLRLRSAAQQWQTTGHDVSALWRGALLQEAKRYSDLNDLEQAFLDASVEAEGAREQAREMALQRKIEQTRLLADAERRQAEAERERAEALEELTIQTRKLNRRLVVLAIVLAVIGTMTLVASIVALNERNVANQQARMAQTSEANAVEARSTAVSALDDAQTSAQEARAALRLAEDNARTAAEALDAARQSEREAQLALATAVSAQETAQASAIEAQRQSELARSGQIAAQAFRLQNDQLDLSLLLSLEAIRTADTVEARSVLVSGLQNAARLTRLQLVGALRAHQDRVFTTDFWPSDTAVVTPTTGISLAVSGGYDNQIIFWNLDEQRPLYVFEDAHSSWVRRVRFNEAGDLLASGGYDNRVRLWNTSNLPHRRPTLAANLSGHSDAVNGLAFVPDTNPTAGDFLISGGRDGLVLVWEVTNPQQPIRRATVQNGPTDKVYDLAVSPNGRVLAIASADSNIYLYDISNPGFPSNRPIRVLDGHSTEVNSLAFSPDGNLLASGDDAGRIIMWRVATGENLGTLAGHANWILSVDFHPNGQILSSSSRDNTIILWDVPALSRLSGPFVAHEDWVWEARFNADGDQLLSAGRDNVLYLWELFVSEQLDVELTSFDTAVSSLTYGDDEIVGVGLAAGEVWAWPVTATTSSAATTWTLADLPALAETADPAGLVVAVGPGRNHAAVISDTQVLLWPLAETDLNPAPQTLSGHDSAVRDIAFAPDGQYLASVGCVGDELSGAELTLGAEENSTTGTEEPMAQILPSELPPCTTSEVWLWDVASATAVFAEPLIVSDSELISVNFSPDGSVLATAGCQRLPEESPAQDMLQQQEAGDKNLCQLGETILWQVDAEAGRVQELRRIGLDPLSQLPLQADFVMHTAVSYDNAVLATASADRTLAFWDVATGEALSAPLSGHTGQFNDLAFSPDNDLLVTVGDDRDVLLWDTRALQRLSVPFRGHNTAVLALSFRPDGRFLVTGDEAGDLIRWRTGLDSWTELACNITGRNMTPAEWTQYIGQDVPYRVTCGDE